jgi:hypothetical protein
MFKLYVITIFNVPNWPGLATYQKRPLCDRGLKLLEICGGPSRNRTENLLIKSQVLCLVELTARVHCLENVKSLPNKLKLRLSNHIFN